ncbi:MAG: histidine kinase [Bryobacteraceae bacterium]
MGGALTAAGVALELLRLESEGSRPEIAARIARIQKMIDDAMDEVRKLSRELRNRVE